MRVVWTFLAILVGLLGLGALVSVLAGRGGLVDLALGSALLVGAIALGRRAGLRGFRTRTKLLIGIVTIVALVGLGAAVEGIGVSDQPDPEPEPLSACESVRAESEAFFKEALQLQSTDARRTNFAVDMGSRIVINNADCYTATDVALAQRMREALRDRANATPSWLRHMQ